VQGGRSGTVASLNRSNGGLPKRAVTEARITRGGMEGDRQRNLKHHGGPDRALCLYSAELIEVLRAEGHAAEPGALGENVTIAGVDWRLLEPGYRMAIGAVAIELTAYAFPCRNIAPVFADRRSRRVSPIAHPGESRVYARVLEEGVVRTGDLVVLL
jgi:MOSC domain-containing protein YiiM